jgi:hypothetical protein
MGVSDEAKNVIPLKFLRKIKNKNFSPLVNSIRGHTVDTAKLKAMKIYSLSSDRLLTVKYSFHDSRTTRRK